MKKILVTGGAGFIGSHLAQRLVKAGYIVIGIDNINNYYSPELKYSRLSELGIDTENIIENQKQNSLLYSNYQFVRLDFTNYDKLISLFEKERFDIVIHLGAQAGVRYSLENPQAYIQSNIVGFMNILECCRLHKIEHLVYASSSSVYGNSNDIPFSEDDRVDYPVSLYAATKKSNELMAYTYSHLYKLPTTGLRFFTVYGPWGRPDMSPVIFAKAIMEETPIKVFNNGDMQRDFTYVADIVEGTYKVMMNYPDENSYQPHYNLYNIGSSNPIQLLDFIGTLEKHLNKKAIKEFLPMQPGDVYKTYADISRLKRDVSYNPSTSLDEGVKAFVNWYINQTII